MQTTSHTDRRLRTELQEQKTYLLRSIYRSLESLCRTVVCAWGLVLAWALLGHWDTLALMVTFCAVPLFTVQALPLLRKGGGPVALYLTPEEIARFGSESRLLCTAQPFFLLVIALVYVVARHVLEMNTAHSCALVVLAVSAVAQITLIAASTLERQYRKINADLEHALGNDLLKQEGGFGLSVSDYAVVLIGAVLGLLYLCAVLFSNGSYK